MLPSKLAFVDIETTGMSLTRDRIIEIGILRVEENQLVKSYQTLINPQTYISPFIEQMTGIQKDELDAAPMFEDVKETILELLEDCIFVAHNVRFDYGFIKSEFERFNRKFQAKHFCTVKLSRLLYPRYRHHNLDSLIKRFQFDCTRRHRAFDDAAVLFSFYQTLQKNFEPSVLEEALARIMKKAYLPIGIPPETIETLPQTPGVYIFYGKDGMPLYVGKSKNIKDRVLSHFSSDLSFATERKIAQQVASIETYQTPGELGALLKEAMLIKSMQPLYNKKQRLAKKLVVLRYTTTQEGYNTVIIDLVDTFSLEMIHDVICVVRSKKQAKELLLEKAKEHKLCQRLLGLEKTEGYCFGYHLEQCKGACQTKEDPLFYNMRFTLAFPSRRVKPWPFNGPISIKESWQEKTEYFIIDKWCLLGTMTYDHTTGETVEHLTTQEYTFDYDAYTILQRHLLSKTAKPAITSLSSLGATSLLSLPSSLT